MTLQRWSQTIGTLELSGVRLKGIDAEAPTPASLSQTLGHGAWATVLCIVSDSNYAARVKNHYLRRLVLLMFQKV